MRAVVGTTPQALARRGVALDRLAVLGLRRDAYAATPGAEAPLWLGERTQYRASAAVLDAFERAVSAAPDGALGAGYTPLLPATTPSGLTLVAQQVVPVAASAAGHIEGYATVLARDQWGEVTLGALTSGASTAAVGVGVRWVETTGYLATATRGTDGVGHATLVRYNAGVATTLADVITPWQVGETLRLTAEWTRLRVYRHGTLLCDVVDASPLLVTGQAALYAWQSGAGAAAAIRAFVAGPLRQEYQGLLADLGDVSASLGVVEPTASPAAWAMSVINLGAVGGADRFTHLLRHGANAAADTYDLHRVPVTLAQAVQGGSASLGIADGRVQHPEALSESVVRLVCVGRDALLTPQVSPGRVVYLPGPDPVSTAAPIPTDPCGADAPQPVPVDGGVLPEEPLTPADGGADGGADGVADGPEASPPVPLPSALLGEWIVDFGWGERDEEGLEGAPILDSPSVQMYRQPEYSDPPGPPPGAWAFFGYAGLPIKITMIRDKPVENPEDEEDKYPPELADGSTPPLDPSDPSYGCVNPAYTWWTVHWGNDPSIPGHGAAYHCWHEVCAVDAAGALTKADASSIYADWRIVEPGGGPVYTGMECADGPGPGTPT